ncbi:MAG: dihydroneopterin triphosphate diphosphatase [Candidatus Nitricoxidivorans perseverans]|uniref:Dihydroneopterin triphosphate diphosphatase n=1 Tax=Candidatus Nitricoxidivorans perseverans TaxID=2975601 RepID=A0AA49IY91_9PROT|nr:MAG: dihydroneopterin triphosphate diphosphatase [Candidatus Nitricoxidivorans perseverans]
MSRSAGTTEAPKKPVSVLVVVHTHGTDPDVLLLERAGQPGFWQSVTGSQEDDEPLETTARREVAEETGIVATGDDLTDWRLSNRFEILPGWRSRYGPGITRNTEHVFSLCLQERRPVVTAPGEHLASRWLPWREAAAACFSWSNRDAILMLGLGRCGA